MESRMQQHGSNYWLQTPPPHPDPGVGVKIIFWSEHGHVVYQMKRNHKCCNMVANILLEDPPPIPPNPHPLPRPRGRSQKVKFNWLEIDYVAYEIIGNHICSSMLATPEFGKGDNRSKFNFFRTSSCCLSFLTKWSIAHHACTYPLLTNTLNLSVGLKGKWIFWMWSCCISN